MSLGLAVGVLVGVEGVGLLGGRIELKGDGGVDGLNLMGVGQKLMGVGQLGAVRWGVVVGVGGRVGGREAGGQLRGGECW